MDLGVREWMIIIGVLLIVAVVLDGYRRVRNERRGRIRVSLSRQARRAAVVPSSSAADDEPEEKDNPELPNGGARPASRRRGFGGATVPVLMQPADDRTATRSGRGSVDTGRGDDDSARRPADAWDDEPFADDDDVTAGQTFAEEPLPEDAAWPQADEAGSAPTTGAYLDSADDYASDGYPAGRHPYVADLADDDASWDESDQEWSHNARAASAPRFDDRPVARHDAASPRNDESSRYVEPDEAPAAPPAGGQPQEVLVVYVVSRDRQGFKGQDLLQILLACDVRYAKSHLFYRYEEAKGQGRVQFGVANLTEAGTFELDSMEQQLIPGVCFFITLPGPAKSLEAFRCLVETAQVLVKNLDGEMRDESRSVMTAQTLEHYRQRIRDFERKQLTFHI